MGTFEDIQKQIQQTLTEKRANPAQASAKGKQNQDDEVIESCEQIPAPVAPYVDSGSYGVVMSLPGTEKVILDTSTVRFMECDSAAPLGKYRHCIVARGVKAKYHNLFVDSNGDRTYIVPREVFNLLTTLVSSAARQVQTLTMEKEHLLVERDLYKMTVESFKKTGLME